MQKTNRRDNMHSVHCTQPMKIIRNELLNTVSTSLGLEHRNNNSVRKAMYEILKQLYPEIPKSLNAAIIQLNNIKMNTISNLILNNSFIYQVTKILYI